VDTKNYSTVYSRLNTMSNPSSDAGI
jgi:hypothetical protein